MNVRLSDLTIARQVRAEHANGGTCVECEDRRGPCPRLAAWAPWIYVLEARRQ